MKNMRIAAVVVAGSLLLGCLSASAAEPDPRQAAEIKKLQTDIDQAKKSIADAEKQRTAHDKKIEQDIAFLNSKIALPKKRGSGLQGHFLKKARVTEWKKQITRLQSKYQKPDLEKRLEAEKKRLADLEARLVKLQDALPPRPASNSDILKGLDMKIQKTEIPIKKTTK
ncbi:MAG: hypothetical protein ABIJ96_02540 [Elusimicrobiota bacterium]